MNKNLFPLLAVAAAFAFSACDKKTEAPAETAAPPHPAPPPPGPPPPPRTIERNKVMSFLARWGGWVGGRVGGALSGGEGEAGKKEIKVR